MVRLIDLENPAYAGFSFSGPVKIGVIPTQAGIL